MTSWGNCLGYTNVPCPNCGRYRVQLYENNKRVCEKCEWCIEDNSYVDVFAEEEEQMLKEYEATFKIGTEKVLAERNKEK